MTLKKLQLRPGVNQENTRYTNENGWWVADKVRFRQGTPEKIGGYVRWSASTFAGICRSLNAWVTLGGAKLLGIGTNEKFYIGNGGAYYDITPIRNTAALTDPFTATLNSYTLLVTDVAHGASVGDYVIFSGASGLGGNLSAAVLNQEYRVVEVLTDDTYTIETSVQATAADVAGSPGGGSVSAAYLLGVGPAIQVPTEGWGVGAWGTGAWGIGTSDWVQMRLWSQSNFGEDLLYAPRGGEIYWWDADTGLLSRGVAVTGLPGASDAPTAVNSILVSDVSRFVLAFGCNELGSLEIDPMLVRWSDQEDFLNWTPAATNQAGGLRLSIGSEIVARTQLRQEILVWTDAALYSLQYQGAPAVWGAQIMADNISVIGPNATATAEGVAYWMGNGKFYKYDGRVQTMRCDLRQYVFQDFNYEQALQVFAGTNEAFNEVWWFYPSGSSDRPDKYVVYNYAEDVWYQGDMARYAWLDSGILDAPYAANSDKLVVHEQGVDDATGDMLAPLPAYIESAEFDIEDGDRFGFIWRLLPDLTFRGSSAANPSATFTLYPMKDSGSGFGDSVGGSRAAGVTRSVAVPVEQFTGQVYIRVRGRQLVMRVESTDLGVTWQLGSPRIDIRADGRRG
jgi:hypothetical protein